ncbi:MAG TPA: acyl carrier protein [Rubrivivax sp.]|nr:acyl carrier protein [Rubrivivax sp.]
MSHFPRLQTTIAETLKIPPASITPETRDEDVPAWDSLGHVKLIMAIEQAFDLYIEVDDFGELKSVPAILGYLQNNGAS